MKVQHLKGALTPSNGYICLSCRLRRPYTDLQPRRQQHVANRFSRTKPELLALLSDLGPESSKQEDKGFQVITQDGDATPTFRNKVSRPLLVTTSLPLDPQKLKS